MVRRLIVMLAGCVLASTALVVAGAPGGSASADTLPAGPLHTGTDGVIYDATNQPVRLVGFNWTGTENGGRSDFLKTADVCGVSWRVPSDRIGDLPFDYDNLYQVISGLGLQRDPAAGVVAQPRAGRAGVGRGVEQLPCTPGTTPTSTISSRW